MPELPEVEALARWLQPQLVGQRVEGLRIYRPLVFRNLLGEGDPAQALVGRQVLNVTRRGKFLVFALEGELWLAVHFMLLGNLEPCEAHARPRTRDYYVLSFSGGLTLRYHDLRGMGKTYLTDDLARVPGMADLGPDALDPALTPEAFLERLLPHRGEIKGVLTRERAVSGIGNAYADEILFVAGIYPFRKRTQLSRQEQERLYAAMRQVLTERVALAVEQVARTHDMHLREGMLVHGRPGEPCPNCGTPISEINVARRPTHFCRHCQPGLLLRN
jgi:formamidopyrimidine-DNA glycosylase